MGEKAKKGKKNNTDKKNYKYTEEEETQLINKYLEIKERSPKVTKKLFWNTILDELGWEELHTKEQIKAKFTRMKVDMKVTGRYILYV